MMKRFEVGHEYESLDCSINAIKVIKRTDKFIFVSNGINEWRMKIREAEGKNGFRYEYVVDSSAGYKWRDAFTFTASLEH